jgi:hypothetical protein
VLKILQRVGVSKVDIQIHIERLRAVNDRIHANQRFEANALLALDVLLGEHPTRALRWDSAEIAKVYIPKCIDEESLRSTLSRALQPSDLLPPRPSENLDQALASFLVDSEIAALQNFEYEPTRADFFRVPKDAFTTRPAALLTVADRMSYEALADRVVVALQTSIPQEVRWPRGLDTDESVGDFQEEVAGWDAPYIAKADISSFYECIDHSLLVLVLASQLEASAAYTHAVEGFLTTVMGGTTGIPQGPPASEIYASIYLLPVDKRLSDLGLTYIRYADDFYFAAESVGDGQKTLQLVEGLLQEIHLRLNSQKTKVMRHETYVAGLQKGSRAPAVRSLRRRLRAAVESSLLASADEDHVANLLRNFGVDEEVLWDVFYHQKVSLEEVITSIRERLEPSWSQVYAIYFRQLSEGLARGRGEEDLVSVERLSKEALTFLAAAETLVALDDVERVLLWFPRLAPNVSSYLMAIADEYREDVSSFLQGALQEDGYTDWTRAWLCQVLERVPDLMSGALQEVVKHLARDQATGLLTASSAVRVLARAGQLDETTWRESLARATQAIKSEMFFSAWAERSNYLWLGEVQLELAPPVNPENS